MSLGSCCTEVDLGRARTVGFEKWLLKVAKELVPAVVVTVLLLLNELLCCVNGKANVCGVAGSAICLEGGRSADRNAGEPS